MQAPENQPNQVNHQIRTDSISLTSKLIGTFFCIGYTPLAPGTAGSFAALVPFIIFPFISKITIGVLVLIGFVLGTIAARRFEQVYGDDPQVVVIDEVVGMWITMLFVPIATYTLVVGFLLFRFFDILKPFPIKILETPKNGFGIMLDDVGAGIYAGIVTALMHHFFL